jgi:hypothetical protein
MEDYMAHKDGDDPWLDSLIKTVLWPVVPRTGEYIFIQAMQKDGFHYNAETKVKYVFHDFGDPAIVISGEDLRYEDYKVFAAEGSGWEREYDM